MPTCSDEVTSPGAAPPAGAPETYAVLTETDGKRTSTCYFIRWEGNEEALRDLQDRLGDVAYWFTTNYSGVPFCVFALDLDHRVSATTVEEMSKLETNHQIWCTKLDGEMQTMLLSPRGSEYDGLDEVSNKIGFGRIKKFFKRPRRGSAVSSRPARAPPRTRGALGAEYVVYAETDDEFQNNYYFIPWKGNEKVLRHLQSQLDKVSDWITTGGGTRDALPGAFGLDLDHPVSAATVEEMLKVEANGHIWCTKLHGKMRPVDFGFTKRDPPNDENMSRKVCSVIGRNGIEKFFDEPAWAPGPPRLYAVLIETTDDHLHDYYFIRWEGNEQALRRLRGQLEWSGDGWFDDGRLDAFVLDVDHLVPAAVVREILKVDTNDCVMCMRLDGKMSRIDFAFTQEDWRSGYGMPYKVTNKIGRGRIRRFFTYTAL